MRLLPGSEKRNCFHIVIDKIKIPGLSYQGRYSCSVSGFSGDIIIKQAAISFNDHVDKLSAYHV